jgi:hypothetical protein
MTAFARCTLLTCSAVLLPFVIGTALFYALDVRGVSQWISIPGTTAMCLGMYYAIFTLAARRLV